MHPHDGEPVPLVLALPGLDVGKRADAVDAGVGPKIDQHHLPSQARQAERPAARGVEPSLGAGELGRPARGPGAGNPPRPPGARPRSRNGRRAARRCSSLDGGALLQLDCGAEERRRDVVGDRALELQVEVGHHQAGDGHHHHPHGHLHLAPIGGETVGDPPAAADQEVEDGGRADRVGESDRQLADREVLGRRDRDHAGEDRARAGRVDEAEAGPDQKPGAEPVPARPRRARHDPGDPGLEPG